MDSRIQRHKDAEEEAKQQGLGVRLDGKKSVYKSVNEEATKIEFEAQNTTKKKAAPKKAKGSGSGTDPWGLRSKGVEKDWHQMKCPPLEMFFWSRLVVDEFHYLNDKADRARVLSVVSKGLKASCRWALSGTTPHQDFAEVAYLAQLLGVHLGVDEQLLGKNVNARKVSAENREKTALELFSTMLTVHSPQWHLRRHEVARGFLDRFVRQNVAEIDEIRWEEHQELVVLPPAEKAIYLEMETHLRALEMNKKLATKSRKASTSDRESRIRDVLEGSADPEEALLKRCAHFNVTCDTNDNALEVCLKIIRLREEQKKDCVLELEEKIDSAFRQRAKILEIDPDWEGHGDAGDVEDRLAVYIADVEEHQSVNGGADEEVHDAIHEIFKAAKKGSGKKGKKKVEDFDEDEDSDDEPKKKKVKKESKPQKEDNRADDEILHTMKWDLREHMHGVRAVGKELTGRTRSLRYFGWVRDFQSSDCKPLSLIHI
eukprot:TRINITY_DN7029_c0_g1_i2.p1 TRINITY_DN7029_c0_g1~~TRINITY_DN7029_c0_g1_i2.p1  ORF type:complete len:486 (-),score=177.86 TRINITY_DN7029_c0_g1_i2:127-1584(-)